MLILSGVSVIRGEYSSSICNDVEYIIEVIELMMERDVVAVW